MNDHPTFPYVVAKYRNETIGRYASNPYIAALPDLPNDVELAEALKYLPPFDPAERQLPGPVRIQMLDLLERLVVPLPRLVRLARAILKMLRTGYGPRSPFSKSDQEILDAQYELQQSGTFVSASRSPNAAQHSLGLIGASGCGKSYALRTVRSLFAPVIHHPDHGLWQVPLIFVEMPYDGESLHTLATEIFQELDRVLPDANYSSLYIEHQRLNAQQRLALALKCAYRHGVGMIIVDESQNQRGHLPVRRERKNAATSKPKLEIPLTKLLISASNTSHVPLCFSGTLEMNALLGPRFSKSRRHAGRGSGLWMPLESTGNLKAPGEFEYMLASIWRYQWIQRPVQLNEAWIRLFYELTQGIPDIIIKLFESSQECAIANKSETLTEELVRTVFKAEFFTTELGISALRDQSSASQALIPDLLLADSVEDALDRERQFAVPTRRRAPKRPASPLPQVAAPAPKPPKAPVSGPAPLEISDEIARNADMRGGSFDPQADEAGAETTVA
jgi:hypothetical protein